MKLTNLLLLTILSLSISCNNTPTTTESELKQEEHPDKTRAKFEPIDGECLLFAGQELEAIGGLEEWNDGYYDHFDAPAGFTMYTKIRPGDEEFGFT